MNLHEYQSKKLFAEYGIPVPDGIAAETAEAAHEAALAVGGNLWVVKAQVHAGGRGKAGGVKLAKTPEEVQQYASEMLGTMLVTHQSGPEGLPINVVYVEAGSDIDRELYLSMLVDREVSQVSFIASAAGGMDIEQVAEETPEQILTVAISPVSGVQDEQAQELSAGLGLNETQSGQFADLIDKLYRLFMECDASLIEVNPLIITGSGDVRIDFNQACISFIASAAGGMDIEQVAEETPEQILTVAISPVSGVQDEQAQELSAGLGLNETQSGQFADLIDKLYRLFMECDASLVEINPLIITGSGDVLALDAKINIEDNAMFRQERLLELRDPSQEDEKEREAAEHDLNYVSLDGDIACMVNGAGLAMATMDLIKLHGGEPANFLDVGGGATSERVASAFKLILSNQNVRAILVNIFGGIVRCDLIAQGIISAVKEVGVRVPVVVRLEGTNVIKGRTLLAESGLDIIAADDLTDAAQKAVASAAT